MSYDPRIRDFRELKLSAFHYRVIRKNESIPYTPTRKRIAVPTAAANVTACHVYPAICLIFFFGDVTTRIPFSGQFDTAAE